ncbi:hypothetical protein [Peribacillus glennii]|uniref:Uncharacterized protein n=1 Tax=Peribacillus glennii TaxID=2303991 RepID=A0A372LHV7_9BACI|nr:hypothetical protein [Peribacillus glennii]RFU65887.1 hypothetical protein D0466_08480 [Peribacillus glennii]
MNRLNNQRGYAFIVVLLFIVLIGLTTITLAGFALNAQKTIQVSKTTVEEKIDSEMAMDEAMAKIQVYLNGINTQLQASSGIQLPHMHQKLQEMVIQLNSDSNQEYFLSAPQMINPDNHEFLQVKIDITIPENKKGKLLTKSIILTTVSEIFKYSVFSNNDLYLYGKSEINGNVYIDNNLRLSEYVTFKGPLGFFEFGFKNGYPTINGLLTMKLNNYYYNYRYPFISSDHWYPIQNPAQKLPDYFRKAPEIKNNAENLTPLDVRESIDSKEIPEVTTAVQYNELRIKRGQKEVINSDIIIENDLTIEDNGYLEVNGNIYIKGNLKVRPSYRYHNQGQATLKVQSNSYIYVGLNAEMNNVNLDAPVYINGSAELFNNLNTNSTIYANSTIEAVGMTKNIDGTLVLISEENISLAFNNRGYDSKDLNVYLYSKKDIEIWGYGAELFGYDSNVVLNGGVYGENIYLKSMDDRVKINYKEDIIDNPPRGIPTVQKISMKESKSTYKRE